MQTKTTTILPHSLAGSELIGKAMSLLFSFINSNGIDEAVTVLLVEDDPTQQNLLYHYIHRLNVKIETASTQREALSKIQSADIMILDWKLSGVDAQTVFDRWSDIHTEKPCLVASSYLTPELHMKLLREGAYNTVEKPIDANVLSRIIDRYALMIRQNRQFEKIRADMAFQKKLTLGMLLLLVSSNYEMAQAILDWLLGIL